MLRFKASIRRLFWMFCVLFVLLGASLSNTVINKDDYISNPYNKHLYMSEDGVKRGNILDTNGKVLVESILDGENYKRVYNYPDLVSNITGYTTKGKTGVESSYNYLLEEIDGELIQRLKNVIFGKEILCKSIALTIDLDLQELSLELLGNNKGAVVVMEADTGKIIAMASNPSFNSNTIYEDWDRLNSDENGPLLNRATQGLYPPGSTFKIVTLLSALQNNPELLKLTYECKGSEYFDGQVIRCFNETVHGRVNAKEAFTESCNCYFASLGKAVGSKNLRKTAEKLCFNNAIGLDLNYSVSRIDIESDATESELIETSIGQGKTLATPLQMAMITSSIVNEGKMMKPYVLEYALNTKGDKENITIPSVFAETMTAEDSLALKEYMLSVVENGTGYAADVDGLVIGGKTGTAENPNGSDHLWFTGFCGDKVVAVVLENPNGGYRASEIAGKIFKHISE